MRRSKLFSSASFMDVVVSLRSMSLIPSLTLFSLVFSVSCQSEKNNIHKKQQEKCRSFSPRLVKKTRTATCMSTQQKERYLCVRVYMQARAFTSAVSHVRGGKLVSSLVYLPWSNLWLTHDWCVCGVGTYIHVLSKRYMNVRCVCVCSAS